MKVKTGNSALIRSNTWRVLVLAFMLFSSRVVAQSGMPFSEFSAKLELYYDKAMVEDVRRQLPQGTDFRVWGWDVGDFSGDGNFDVAFSIRLNDDKKRQVQMYLFVDIDGFLNNVLSDQLSFVETPLEVGMVIKNNTCYVTSKMRQFEWNVSGYRFREGAILQVDQFTTTRIDHYTREYYCNFQTLRHELKFLQTATGDVNFDVQYVGIPCYSRGRQTYRGYSAQADVNTVDFVTHGSYYWSGPDDCSFSVHSVFDQNYLYMTITVRDDELVTARCDSCPADNVDIWFDTTMPDDENDRVFRRKGHRMQFRSSADSNIIRITLQPGDFMEKRPNIIVRSNDLNEERLRALAVKQITKKVALREHGYVARIRIPFSLLGFTKAPVDDKDVSQLGCTVVVHDIDNEYRPEEESTLATSQIEAMNPSTFGTLYLIPQARNFGLATNIFSEALMKNLLDLGF